MSSQSKYTIVDKPILLNDVLQNHAEIVTTVDNYDNQTFVMDFTFNADPTGNLGFMFDVPAGAVMKGSYSISRPADTCGVGVQWNTEETRKDVDFTELQTILVANLNPLYSTNIHRVHAWGYIATNGTAGNIQWKWAQNTIEANPTTVNAGVVFTTNTAT